MTRHLLLALALIIICASCAHKESKGESPRPASTPTARSESAVLMPRAMAPETVESSKSNLVKLNLDEKSRAKVDDAFRAVIKNDDKKAKTAYGRSYKFMPEFVQFAFDLRFKNYDHAGTLVEKLSYDDSEKEFWQKLSKSKPKVVSKAICDELKKVNFEIPKHGAMEEELFWFRELETVIDQEYRSELDKGKTGRASDLNEILASLKYKDMTGKTIGLDEEGQKKIYSDSFFDKMRNAQRRDTRFWTDSFRSPLKVWTYQRGFIPAYAFDLYASMTVTENPRQNHYMKRIKGIIKDMRAENSLFRQRGDALIEDDDDLKKAIAISNFMNRYLIITTFMNLDPALASCGLSH